MKISTKGRYALRLMLDIALHQAEGPIPLGDISRRQELSIKYLEQLVSPLTRAGLLRSTRGASGGYSLTRPPEDYTAGEIIRTLEGSLAPTDCCLQGECSGHRDVCVTIDLWREVQQAVDAVVDGYTLQDLADRYKAKNPAE
ncbi:MAG: Rrf2 family transcriptional regulator [Oscillospiraceae bacterium]